MADDQQLQLADVYAQALFDLAREAGKIEEYQAELSELVAAEQANGDFALFMASEALASERREEGLERMFRGRLSDDVLNTLLVLNRNDRVGLTAALSRAFDLRVQAHAEQVEVIAVTAVPLDETQQAEVVAAAREMTGGEPLVRYQVDPDMLGGLILQVADLRYDNSVRRHLRGIRESLAERGGRGIEITTE